MHIEISETVIADKLTSRDITTLLNRVVQNQGAKALGPIFYEALVTRERHVEFLQKFTERMSATVLADGVAGVNPCYNKDLITHLQKKVDEVLKPAVFEPPVVGGTSERRHRQLRWRCVAHSKHFSETSHFIKDGWRLPTIEELLAFQEPMDRALPELKLRSGNWVWVGVHGGAAVRIGNGTGSDSTIMFNPLERGGAAIRMGIRSGNGTMVLVKEECCD
jgi:hypothetical protein